MHLAESKEMINQSQLKKGFLSFLCLGFWANFSVKKNWGDFFLTKNIFVFANWRTSTLGSASRDLYIITYVRHHIGQHHAVAAIVTTTPPVVFSISQVIFLTHLIFSIIAIATSMRWSQLWCSRLRCSRLRCSSTLLLITNGRYGSVLNEMSLAKSAGCWLGAPVPRTMFLL